jgi:hypothetical protein
MRREINSRIYDENILKEGMQFQIDTYYEPKEDSARRRIDVVMEAIDGRARRFLM